jgi:hypothetical protein
MCILVHQPAGTTISEAMLHDFYTLNPDGFGAMFAVDNKIEIVKTLAKEDEIIKIYNDIVAGKEAVIHFRMKTHGDIDLDNCHPYRVTDDIWLAHNGILSEGNPIDKKKSDTWHYIEYVLRPTLTAQPELFDNPDFIDYLGTMIGDSNKFGLLRNDGKVQLVNRESGVDHAGLWLSNTYAWSPEKHGFYQNKSYKGYSYGRWDDEEYGAWGTRSYKYQHGTSPQRSSALLTMNDEDYAAHTVTPKRMNKIVKAAWNSWRRGNLLDWVITAPDKARSFLMEYYNDETGEIGDMVDYDPESAAEWIEDLFTTDGVPENEMRYAGAYN